MTVKELKTALLNVPDDMDVMIEKYDEEYRYNMAEAAKIMGVKFTSSEIPKKQWPTIDCFVITDNPF